MTNGSISLRRPVRNTEGPREGVPHIQGLHHWAYRCRNAEETRHFYEDILGLPLAAVVYHDRVPSTGEEQPYYHLFFEMADGAYIAFFDLLDGQGYTPDPNSPTWLHHIAFEVDSRESLEAAKSRLQAAGVEVLGVVPHGWFDSIYFFDPNGMRLELVHRTESIAGMEQKARTAHELLAQRGEKLKELEHRRARG